MAGVKSSVGPWETGLQTGLERVRPRSRPPAKRPADPAAQLYESIPHAVLVLGRDAHILHANPAAEAILGLSLAAMRGRRPDELWIVATEDGRPLPNDCRPEMRAIATRNAVHGQQLRVRRPDSDWRWIQADAVPVLGADGEPFQVVCSFFDVSDRRRSEAALKESERDFRSMFAGAGIGIARLRLDGTIADVNPALAQMLGYPDRDLEGKQLEALIYEDDVADLRLGDLARFDLGTVRADVRCLSKDGRTLWTRTVASLVRDGRGEPASVILTVEDISDQKAQQRALEHQVLHDGLTGLPNRTLLHDRLSQAVLVGRREGHHLALLLMDLDRFKEVNDTLGHQAGDQLLRQVAARLREELRVSDTVARLGGDEFAIILPGVGDEEGAAHAASKLITALDSPFEVAGERLHVEASIGIALFPEQGEDVDTLLRRADIAMYVAKRGDSAFAVYSPDQDEHSPTRLALMGELRQAIDENQLVLFYQPKVDLRSGEVVGVEALVRWQHPRMGMLQPDRFMPLAEHSGLVRPLDRWVLEEVIKQSREWRDKGFKLTVAINLSMRTLHDRELPDFIAHLLEKYGVEASSIQIEITESTLMANPELAVEVTTRLAEMGVRLAIDDFGTGYSSLAYVRRLQAAEIKIDRSFVLEMAKAENDAVIVQSTIDLGRNLGLQVVAEGVEDQETRALLLAGGCQVAQGFALSRPLSSEELAQQLASGESTLTPPPAASEPAKAGRRVDRLRRPAFSFDEVNRRLAVLEPVALFFALPSSDVWRLARHMQPEYLPAGAEIIAPGLGGDSLRIIEEGLCEVSLMEAGTRVPVLTLGPSEFMGGESLAPEDQLPVYVRALTDVKLLVLEREVLTRTLPADSELFDALRQVASQRKARLISVAARAHVTAPAGSAGCIAVYSPKGGSGKTTLALNLAAKLSAAGVPGDVLLVDMSLPFNHAALMANLVPTSCLARVAQSAPIGTDGAGGLAFERLLLSALLPHPTGFMMLPTALKAEEADLVDPALIMRALEVLSRQFRHIVFDLGVALTDNVLSILEMSQHLVTVSTPELAAMADTAQVLDIVTRVLQMPVGRVHVVLNHRTPHSPLRKKDVEAILKREIRVEFPYEGARPENAAVRGMLLGAADPRGRFHAGMLELVRVLS